MFDAVLTLKTIDNNLNVKTIYHFTVFQEIRQEKKRDSPAMETLSIVVTF